MCRLPYHVTRRAASCVLRAAWPNRARLLVENLVGAVCIQRPLASRGDHVISCGSRRPMESNNGQNYYIACYDYEGKKASSMHCNK